ncbi:hypothetical protein [Nocardia sp. NPDC052316]|uniref:NucA/NucB deoxyribonuclease domain-containing protein n=1 Tax=Nocardia sp. NPDC052316 TaxID=3364329 RepID=UPI0037CA56BA
MRSDCQDIPGGFTKEQADRAETMEATVAARPPQRSASAPDGCQVYWPAPYEVCGAIRDKYNELGGPNSFLLFPTSNELTNPDGVGKRSTFQNGPIYWSPAGGAHPVANHFFAAWQRNGWEGGVLGYPTSDEIVNPDNIGRRQYFQGGTIYWKLNEAYYVAGAIRDKWGETGWEGGYLGYPISDETGTPDGVGRFNRFERGVIFWSPSGGVHPVSGGILTKWSWTNYERGPYGYPVSDQRKRGQAFDQDFQFGTIGWPTSAVEGEDVDWQEDYIDENNCNDCGDDERIRVTGPAHLDVPQPDPLSAPPSAERASNHLPDCGAVSGDPAAPEGELGFCAGAQEGNSARTGDTWQTALQPYCNDLPERQWAGDRKYQCMWRRDVAYLYSKRDGSRIGEIQYVQEHELRTAWNSPTWQGRSAIHILHAFGAATQARYDGAILCLSGGSCSLGGNYGFHDIEVVTTQDYIMDYTATVALTPGAIINSTLNGVFTFKHDGAKPPTYNAPTGVFPVVRCDHVTGFRDKAGCVVPAAQPILDLTTRGVAAHAGHIGYAQSSGLPGKPNGTPLTRTTDAATIQNNRNISCNRVPGPRPSGQQCDEYPFASTKQGGGANGPARTYSNSPCEQTMPGWVNRRTIPVSFYDAAGISMCMMPGRDNLRGGGILSWFYVKNRVHDGEAFYVKGS